MEDNQEMQKEIEKQARSLYDRVINRYYNRSKWDHRSLGEMIDEELLQFNYAVSPLIESAVYDVLDKNFTTKTLPKVVPTKAKLSEMLYRNAKQVAGYVKRLFLDHGKSRDAVINVARKIYDGYGFRSKDMIDARKDLPEYLKRYFSRTPNKKSIERQIARLKTKPLRIAYQKLVEVADGTNKKALENAVKVALEEKSRYYANRIAVTESQRSKNFARAKEYLDDDEIEFVRYRMSSKHPMMDICDYYANLDVGYGKGIVPKEQMIHLPLHQHCMCRYDPYYRQIDKKNPVKWIEKQPEHVQRQVLGGYEQWKRWKEGASVESVFNMTRPKYPIRQYVDVLGIKTAATDFG